MELLHELIGLTGIGLLLMAGGYEAVAALAFLVFEIRRRWRVPANPLAPPLTVLKPLCGAEPGLYENLRSFCAQDYPRFQIVFGVQDGADPALAVVTRLRREFPTLPMRVVVSGLQHGSNRKISSLINMLPSAEHDLLMIADSDARVGPDYLSGMVAPLSDPGVGLVTCIYRGMPTTGVWSRLGAMYVNDWYMPSVLVAWLFGHREYASGLTLCLRRETLQATGGLQHLCNHLADDYELGALVRGTGLKIALSSQVPRTGHSEDSLDYLVAHETRWMRTIRVLRPKSFRFLFLSFGFPLALLGLVMSAELQSVAAFRTSLLLAAVAARLTLFMTSRLRARAVAISDLCLLPVRELLLCWVWWRASRTSVVTWRGAEFTVDAEGIMRSVS
ncbi:MAG: bacteriohopanetetrol glucosamine biosynthesis glycosyltransferase HpnI [Proteobacteria bacterium]|nr:bacteriohopanetetrol glucosamine biosynthesis glycosyltransferase HpnI [Pseudomonadota bacterium]